MRMNVFFTHCSLVSTKLFSSGATRRLLQSGRCFAALVNCRFMHHGRRFHCATPATVLHFLSGLPQAKMQYRRGVASSEQLPSREPFRLFDEKRVAPFFSLPLLPSGFAQALPTLSGHGQSCAPAGITSGLDLLPMKGGQA